MAENELIVAAPRERVFAILADPDRYAEWLESAVDGVAKLAEPVTGAMVGLRNAMSLRRLKELAAS
jgi:uncharacterized protein YndB with AHSA1/START domain